MLKPRTLDCDVEPKQTSKEALQSGKNPTCIFYNSCSATEAGIGLLFIVYRTLHVKIDLLEKYVKKGLLETKLYIFLLHGPNKQLHSWELCHLCSLHYISYSRILRHVSTHTFPHPHLKNYVISPTPYPYSPNPIFILPISPTPITKVHPQLYSYDSIVGERDPSTPLKNGPRSPKFT